MQVLGVLLSLVSLQVAGAQSHIQSGAEEDIDLDLGNGLLQGNSSSHRLSFSQVDLENVKDDDGMQYQGSIWKRKYSWSELFLWNNPNPFAFYKTTFAGDIFSTNGTIQQISKMCAKKDFFYGMNPNHSKAVSKLKNALMDQQSPIQWMKLVEKLRDHKNINPHVWLRATVSSLIHRRDINEMGIPAIAEVIPSLFFTTEVLTSMKQKRSMLDEPDKCVVVDETVGKDNGLENLAWYFREDVMVNSHHWYWHLAYPIDEENAPDRGGELFYFMHHDMLARYHSNRLSVGLPPAGRFSMEPGSQIKLAYNAHLNDENSGRNWTARPANVTVSDIDSDALFDTRMIISIRNRSIQLDRLFEGISNGSLIDQNGQTIRLDTKNGINILGNTVEANVRSVNPEFYGTFGVHNDGHLIIGLVMDPKDERELPPGVMGDTATSMRDVMFYQHHGYTDWIFRRFKATLPSYKLTQGKWPLVLDGIRIQNFTIRSRNLTRNHLHTFWSSKKYDLSRGLDFGRSLDKGPLWVCVKHLNHQDFEYDLHIRRKRQYNGTKATVRLFAGPRYDLHGRRYALDEQRSLMFILDTFNVPLKVGLNKIRRKSTDTPLTIGMAQSLHELQNQTGSQNGRPFCGCGWPHHLLLPKGNKTGVSFDVFAMITNSEDDAVQSSKNSTAEDQQESCTPAYIYCGLMNETYPDARPVGYPFDRKLLRRSTSMDDLVRQVPNAAYAHVKIVHFDEFRNVPGKK